MRAQVRLFAELMEKKLQEHDKERGELGWRNAEFRHLYGRFAEEIREARREYNRYRNLVRRPVEPDEEEVAVETLIDELVDVANLSMMLVDLLRPLEENNE